MFFTCEGSAGTSWIWHGQDGIKATDVAEFRDLGHVCVRYPLMDGPSVHRMCQRAPPPGAVLANREDDHEK